MDASQLNERVSRATKKLKSLGLLSETVLIDDLINALNDAAEKAANYKQILDEQNEEIKSLTCECDHSQEQLQLFQDKEA